MMSLFSSFDLMIFKFSIFSFPLAFLIFLNVSFKSFFSKIFLKIFFKFLSSFFNSLNNSNFSKIFNFLMLVMLIMIFFLNFYSIYPFFFPVTSQSSFVFIFSLFFFIPIFLFSLKNSFKNFLSHFIPEGSPFILTPFLFLIEITSLMIRPLTLMIRLVANILAGHLLLILLCSFLMNYVIFFPLLSILNMVELAVALIQSYILSTLISLYYSEI